MLALNEEFKRVYKIMHQVRDFICLGTPTDIMPDAALRMVQGARAKYPSVPFRDSPANNFGLTFSWANGVDDYVFNEFRNYVERWRREQEPTTVKPTSAPSYQIKIVDGREVTPPTDAELRGAQENSEIAP